MKGRAEWLVAVVGALLTACHDAPRSNPMDPGLTPEVTVIRADLDPGRGTVALTWTPYSGRQPFAAYRVLRQAQGLDRVDTVAVIRAAEQTTWTDTTLQDFGPERVYRYRVSVTNGAGYTVPSTEVLAGPFTVRWGELLEARPDSTLGTIALVWAPYCGPAFERYEAWRRSYGEESHRLITQTEVAQTTWTDTTPLPGVEYSYWLEVHAAGVHWSSQRREAIYHLPPVELRSLELSAEATSATLAWTPYAGPGFAGYEVIRRVTPYPEEVVGQLEDIASTAYIDSLLDGNTEYVYRVAVRTSWGEGVGVSSTEREGAFYRLQRPVLNLPSLDESRQAVQGLGLAVDEAGGLVVAASAIGTTSATRMGTGLRLLFPGEASFRTVFAKAGTPSAQSPIRLAAKAGRVYVAVGLDGGGTLVGTVESSLEGPRELWSATAATSDALPVGLHLLPGGDLVLFDDQAWMYAFSPTGEALPVTDKLRRTLLSEQGLPVADITAGPGAGPNGGDEFYVLTPERPVNHILGRLYLPDTAGGIFSGRKSFMDDGVGNGRGLTLSPLVAAFDLSRQRLVVLETTGLLQVLDASAADQTKRRYITQWGRFGGGEGEFLLSPRTCAALAVDSVGRVYVADGASRIQIFEP